MSWVPKDGPSDGYNTNGVDRWRYTMIMFEHFSDNHGNFHFTASDAERVKEYIERELSEEENNHCQEIARLTEKHIDKGRR